jgi:tetratricopeptide (TPR) repeat protein
MRATLLLALSLSVLALAGCYKSVREHYSAAQFAQSANDWGTALEEYNEVLKRVPDDSMALFGKARCLYELRRFEEAIPIFEQVLKNTDDEKAVFKQVRYDAEFYRDKCRVELGETIEQDKSTLPPPPMGE